VNQIQAAITQTIQRFVAQSPANRLAHIDVSPIFEEPLVSFADGNDPLFADYKSIIGDFHRTPRELLGLGMESPSGVVVWILPIAKRTRLSNRDWDEGRRPGILRKVLAGSPGQ
jgi:epoxyqueuosine reductase